MAFSNQLFFLFILLLSLSITHSVDLIAKECGSNVINNDVLQANINNIILDLVTKTTSTGFAKSTSGSGNHIIYGTAECRVDITGQDCAACINAAEKEIRTTCANTNESRIWYHQCSLRYSPTNFIGQPDTNLLGVWHSANTKTYPQGFKKSLREFFSVLTVAAAASGEKQKFAWGEIGSHSKLTNEEEIITVYGMAHCTWDLEQSACLECLAAAFNSVKEGIDGSYIMHKSCGIRHEISPFLFQNAAPSPTVNVHTIKFSTI